MTVTIHDVARRLKLSITTVSRALDAFEDVSEPTRQRVLETARQMGCSPNQAASLLLGILLSLLLIGSASAVERPGAVQETTTAIFLPHTSGRHYYLSNANYNGSQVLTACAVGYHLASFWEIQDTSNLTYDYNHPLAHTKQDSGFGPPSSWNGWVRTGFNSSSSNVAGSGNCLNWTSNADTDFGVLVRLTNTWETPPGEIGPWNATSFSCNTIGPVWCVGN